MSIQNRSVLYPLDPFLQGIIVGKPTSFKHLYICTSVLLLDRNVGSMQRDVIGEVFFLASQTYSWKLSQSKTEKNCQGLTTLSLINFSCTCIHRLQDSNPIAWILALPISNSRLAAVVESSLINSMRCAESGASASNVRVCKTEAIISSNLAH